MNPIANELRQRAQMIGLFGPPDDLLVRAAEEIERLDQLCSADARPPWEDPPKRRGRPPKGVA